MENSFEVFPWNRNFETGIKEIDNQHKKLIELINKLADKLTQEEVFEIEESFQELAAYAEYHFKSEEAIWKKCIKDEEIIKAHENSHVSFLPKVIEMKSRKSSVHDTIEDILLFLIRWLAFHIIDEDKRVALIIHAINDGKNLSEAKFISEDIMSGSMKIITETILSMYDDLSVQTIGLIRERKARVRIEKELKDINKKLEKLSITDQLTGLYNRRHFEDVFNRELKRAKRAKSSFSIILLDIDYFKKLNDLYGHNQGDKALLSLANCLRNVTKRANDFAFRVGGEEFAIITSDEDSVAAINIVKILQNNLKELAILNEGSDVSKYLTISAGVLSLTPTEDDNIDSVMKKVDDRLYEAKKRGRDQFVSK